MSKDNHGRLLYILVPLLLVGITYGYHISNVGFTGERSLQNTEVETVTKRVNEKLYATGIAAAAGIAYASCSAPVTVPQICVCVASGLVTLWGAVAGIWKGLYGKRNLDVESNVIWNHDLKNIMGGTSGTIMDLAKANSEKKDIWLMTKFEDWGHTVITHRKRVDGYNSLVANQTIYPTSSSNDKRDGSKTEYAGGMCMEYYWRDVEDAELGLVGNDPDSMNIAMANDMNSGSYQTTGYFCGNFYTDNHGNGDVGVLAIGNDDCPHIQAPAQLEDFFNDCQN